MKDELRKNTGPSNAWDRMLSQQSRSIAGAYSLNQTAIKKEAQRAKSIYKFPATRQKAQLHQHVNKFGYRSPASEISKERACRCCGYTVNIEQIPLCGSTTPLKEAKDELFPEHRQISADSFLFFHFIKMTIGYLLLRSLFCISFKLLATSNSHYCISYPQECSLKGLIVLSLWSQARLHNQQLLQIQSIINVAYLIVAILFLIYYRCAQHSQYINLHAKKYAQDDFTIMVQNIPFFPFLQHQPYDNIEKMPQYYEMLRLSVEDMNNTDVVHSNNPNIVVTEAVRLFFNRQANKWRKRVERKGIEEPQNLTAIQLNFYHKIRSLAPDNISKPVTSVNLCFDLGDLQKVSELREQIMKEHIQHYKNDGYVDESSPNYPPNQVSLLAQKQIEVLKRYAATTNPELTLSHFLKTAFVSFEYEEYKDYFIKQHQSDLKLLYDDQTCLYIKEAPAVEDINWFNLQISDVQRAKSIFKSCLALLLLICTSLGLIWLVQHWRLAADMNVIKLGTKRRFQVTQTGVIFILAATFIIKIFTFIFGKAIDYSVSESQFKTKSGELMATLIQKIVTELIFVLTAFILLSEFGSGKAKSWDQVSVIVILLLAKSVMMRTIISLLSPLRLKQLFSLKWFYSQSSSSLFQIQLNKIFQLPTFDISDRCTFYLIWLLISSFFFAVAGVTSLILLSTYLVNYWIDKWNLLRRSSNPVTIDSRIAYFLLMVLHCDLFFFAFGNFTTMQLAEPTSFSSRNHQSELNRFLHIHLSFREVSIIGIIITAVFIIVSLITPKSFCRDYKTKSKTYSEAQHMFRYRYWAQNPASRMAEQGRYQFLKNTKESQGGNSVSYKNYSLPLAEMKPSLEEKVEVKKAEKDPNIKVDSNMKQNLTLNFEEIDLSKAYKIRKGDEGSGSRSSRKRQAGK